MVLVTPHLQTVYFEVVLRFCVFTVTIYLHHWTDVSACMSMYIDFYLYMSTSSQSFCGKLWTYAWLNFHIMFFPKGVCNSQFPYIWFLYTDRILGHSRKDLGWGNSKDEARVWFPLPCKIMTWQRVPTRVKEWKSLETTGWPESLAKLMNSGFIERPYLRI